MSLRATTTLTLTPTTPFHFDGTVFNPSHFPSNDFCWEAGCCWQTLRWKGESYGIRLRDRGSVEKPKVELTIFSRKKLPKTTMEGIAEEVRWRFDLDSVGVPEFVRASSEMSTSAQPSRAALECAPRAAIHCMSTLSSQSCFRTQ